MGSSWNRMNEPAAPATVRFDRFAPSDLSATPLPPDLGLPRVRGYDIIGVLGSGGMGIVYEARHRELQRRVALKMLHANAVSDHLTYHRSTFLVDDGVPPANAEGRHESSGDGRDGKRNNAILNPDPRDNNVNQKGEEEGNRCRECRKEP